jgi:DNA-binding transcriptional LysR family regulator
MNIDLRLMPSFVVLAEELHFGRAAERLGLAQPALSQQIKRLEAQIGATLFTRGPRQVELTLAGSALLPHARAILQRAQDGVAAAQQISASTRAVTLRVGFLTDFGLGWIAGGTGAFRRQHGDVDVELIQWPFTEPDCGVARSAVDAGVVDRSAFPPEASVHVLWTEPRVVIVARDHPLAAREEVSLAELDDLDLLWSIPPASENPGFRRYWAAVDERGSEPQRQWSCLSAQEYIGSVAAGKAFGLTCLSCCSIYAPMGIRGVIVSDLSPVTVVMAAAGSTKHPDLVEELARHIREEALRGGAEEMLAALTPMSPERTSW